MANKNSHFCSLKYILCFNLTKSRGTTAIPNRYSPFLKKNCIENCIAVRKENIYLRLWMKDVTEKFKIPEVIASWIILPFHRHFSVLGKDTIKIVTTFATVLRIPKHSAFSNVACLADSNTYLEHTISWPWNKLRQWEMSEFKVNFRKQELNCLSAS